MTERPNPPRAKKPSDILGNRTETEIELLDRSRSPQGFRGDVSFLPLGAAEADAGSYRELQDACAAKAIELAEGEATGSLTVNKGRCIMCGRCQELAPQLMSIRSEFARAARTREELVVAQVPQTADGREPREEIGRKLSEKIKKVLGRSLAIREVDAGSCNGCEVEVAALNNPIYDVERFGVHIVASPRHADVLLVTGVGSRNMELALRRTYVATPDPKVVVAMGACACTGGLFGDSYAAAGGIGNIVPIDVFVPGCPPRPEALLYGLFLAVDRIK